MTSFFERLEARCQEINSLLCVGLDPHPEDLLTAKAESARDFCINIIQQTHEIAAAYKPNIAFFEIYGGEGLQALKEVIESIPKEIPVVLDAKRGDISSTADAYAQAVFETLGVDAVTINPYLGQDSLTPFIQDPSKGVFMLCKTSNPGSKDIQDLSILSGDLLYEQVAKLGEQWNCNHNLGLVVGATHPDALGKVRKAAPNLWFLAPGIGAQGGDLEAALSSGLRPDGMGMLIPISRGISRAENPGLAAKEFCEAINQAKKKISFEPQENPHYAQLAEGLLEAGCIKFGEFTLKSGLKSPVYIDLRRLASFPDLLVQVAKAFQPSLQKIGYDLIAPLPYAAMPIGTAISLQTKDAMIYPRKEVKEYGTKAGIEGVFKPGDTAVIIDDLTTTGGSKFEAIEKLKEAGLKVTDIIVLIDRQSGAKEALARDGINLHAVFSLTDLVSYLKDQGAISAEQKEKVINFIQGTK